MPAPYHRRLAAFAAGLRAFRKDNTHPGQDPGLRHDLYSGRQLGHLLTGFHWADPQHVPIPPLPLTYYRPARDAHHRAFTLTCTPGHPRCTACGGQGYLRTYYPYAEEDDSLAEDCEPCGCAEPLLSLPLPDVGPALARLSARVSPRRRRDPRARRPVADVRDEPPF